MSTWARARREPRSPPPTAFGRTLSPAAQARTPALTTPSHKTPTTPKSPYRSPGPRLPVDRDTAASRQRREAQQAPKSPVTGSGSQGLALRKNATPRGTPKARSKITASYERACASVDSTDGKASTPGAKVWHHVTPSRHEYDSVSTLQQCLHAITKHHRSMQQHR
jgi:hypothetical protein